MKISTLLALARSGRLRAFRSVGSIGADVYRACFLVAAERAGLLERLRSGPATLDEVAQALGVPADGRRALEAWLALGERVGLLASGSRGWTLARLAQTLADPAHEDVRALLEEIVGLHQRLVLETPDLLRAGRRLTLADQDGALVARSSRVVEPLVREAVAAVIPPAGALRALEVGCGSGTYMRFCVERNPDLSVTGLELQPQVAEQARQNLRRWGTDARATVETGDVRTHPFAEPFDVVTMHNNIYYFAETEQVAVLRHVRGLLRPGGRLLLTTACRGGSPSVAVLSLWGAMTAGCAPLPTPEELTARMREAGFVEVTARNLAAPLDAFHAFMGRVQEENTPARDRQGEARASYPAS